MGHFPEGILSLSDASAACVLRPATAFVDFGDLYHAPLMRNLPGETAIYFRRSAFRVDSLTWLAIGPGLQT